MRSSGITSLGNTLLVQHCETMASTAQTASRASAALRDYQNLSVFFSDFALSFEKRKGTAAAASNAQPRKGRNLIQPIAMTTNEKDVAIETQANVTPSPMISRTSGIHDTKNRITGLH